MFLAIKKPAGYVLMLVRNKIKYMSYNSNAKLKTMEVMLEQCSPEELVWVSDELYEYLT